MFAGEGQWHRAAFRLLSFSASALMPRLRGQKMPDTDNLFMVKEIMMQTLKHRR